MEMDRVWHKGPGVERFHPERKRCQRLLQRLKKQMKGYAFYESRTIEIKLYFPPLLVAFGVTSY